MVTQWFTAASRDQFLISSGSGSWAVWIKARPVYSSDHFWEFPRFSVSAESRNNGLNHPRRQSLDVTTANLFDRNADTSWHFSHHIHPLILKQARGSLLLTYSDLGLLPSCESPGG